MLVEGAEFLRFLAETFIEARLIQILHSVLARRFLRFLAETFIEAAQMRNHFGGLHDFFAF